MNQATVKAMRREIRKLTDDPRMIKSLLKDCKRSHLRNPGMPVSVRDMKGNLHKII